MNKKGVEAPPAWLVGMIIFIFGFFIVFGVYAKAGEKISEKSPEAVCRGSAVLRMKSTVNIGDDYSVFKEKIKALPLICKTQDKTLKGDKEKVAKQIAESMARCKYQLADGQYANIFLKDEKEKKTDYCFPCYNLIIEGKDFDYITLDELKDTLQKEKNKQIADMSYADYLTGFNKVPGRVQIFTDKIQNNRVYTIYYSDPRSDKGYTISYTQLAADIGVGAFSGWLLGPAAIIGVPVGAVVGAAVGFTAPLVDVIAEQFKETPPFPGIYLADTNIVPKTVITYTIPGIKSTGKEHECTVVDDFTAK